MSNLKLTYADGRTTVVNGLPDSARECRSKIPTAPNATIRIALERQACILDARAAGRKPPRYERLPGPAPARTAPAVHRARQTDVFDGPGDEIRSAAFDALERRFARATPAQLDDIDARLREDSPASTSLARHIVLRSRPGYSSAFWNTMRHDRPLLSDVERHAVAQVRELDELEHRGERRSASEGGSFGLAIPAQIDPTIIVSGGEVNQLGMAVRTVVTVSDTWKGVTADPTGGFEWKAEGTVAGDASPTLAQPVVPVFMADSYIPASAELSADYPDFAEQLASYWQSAWNDFGQKAIAVGSGSGQATGVFTALNATTTNPAHVTVTTAGTIGVVDVRKVWAALPDRYKLTATWAMHSDVLNQIRAIDGAAAQLDLVTDRQGVTLFGRPIIETSYAPDFTGTTGNAEFCVVGDFSTGYVRPVRLGGLTVERIPQTFDSATFRPIYGNGWWAYIRVGGNVVVPNAFRILTNS